MGGLKLAGGDRDGQPFKVLTVGAALYHGRFSWAWRLGSERGKGERQERTGGRDRHGGS